MNSRREILQLGAGLFANSRSAPHRRARFVGVTGPVTGGRHGWPFSAYVGDMGLRGYVEEGYFISGKAQRYQPIGALESNAILLSMTAADRKWDKIAGALVSQGRQVIL